jgi:four helix bundle protein
LLCTNPVNPQALELQERTRRFLKRVIEFCDGLPQTLAASRIIPQLLDSAGSADSNYRGACRGRSRREFIAKIAVAAEEADESKGWLLALSEAGIGNQVESCRSHQGSRRTDGHLRRLGENREAQSEPQQVTRSPKSGNPKINPQSPIRNGQAAIRNPHSPIRNVFKRATPP